MSYQLFNSSGKEVQQHDLQDKPAWCEVGEDLELAFLKVFGVKFDLKLNEEKETKPTAPDFKHNGTGRYVDLKTQNTPFFNAAKYSVDPQYAVTFNAIDLERYSSLYPSIIVIFHVSWEATKIIFSNGKKIEVLPMSGIWAASIQTIEKNCNTKNYHQYQQRLSDKKGNAKGSYVLDLNKGYLQQKHREL